MHMRVCSTYTHTVCGYGLGTGPTEGPSLLCKAVGHPSHPHSVLEPMTTLLFRNIRHGFRH